MLRAALLVGGVLVVQSLSASCPPGETYCSESPLPGGKAYNPVENLNPYTQPSESRASDGMKNPYLGHGQKVYDADGNYRGRANNNRYDPESINRYGQNSNPYAPGSLGVQTDNPYLKKGLSFQPAD